MKPIKSLKDLSTLDSRFNQKNIDNALDLAAYENLSGELEKIIKLIRETNREQVDQVALAEDLNKQLKRVGDQSLKNYRADRVANSKELQHAKNIIRHTIDLEKLEQDIVDRKQKQVEQEKQHVKQLEQNIKKKMEQLNLSKLLGKEAQEIFKISHEMQLTSNMTWKEFSKNYNEAYETARKMNQETGKQLHSAKELIEMQNTLLKDGWKGLDASTLTNIAGATRLMVTTLGQFPEELSTAFQNGFRQFGQETNRFITQVGNQLNAFSDTFGTSIGMLSGVVSQMSSSNSYLMRNNMEMQLQANENLLKAAALSGAIGLTSTNFISDLALTSQYGTADQMGALYQGGALLKGFSTSDFQSQMMGGATDEAISGLFGSISDTMKGVEGNHYLRNQYMQQIGGAFGLSQRDMLQIMANGGDLGAYEDDISEKILDMNTSMVDEVKDLKISVVDKLTTWWNNTTTVQAFGKVMNDLGLHGINKHLVGIEVLLAKIAMTQTKNSIAGGIKGTAAGNMGLIGKGGSQFSPMKAGAGLIGFTASQALGSSIQQNTNLSSGVANTGGFLTNIGGGAASGALIGSAVPAIGTTIGAVVGGGIGLINSIKGVGERKSLMQEQADKETMARRNSATPQTGDPVVDALNRQTDVLQDAITGSTDRIGRTITTIETYRKTTTDGNFK